MYKLLKIMKSDKPNKKMKAIFLNNNTRKQKIVYFGASGYSDYTIHKDNKRKQAYIARHQVNEDFNNPISAGSLSRYILWNKPTIKASIEDYKKRFNL